MKGSSHLITGTGVSLACAALLHTPLTPAAAAAAVIGSLLPDIDEPGALLLSRSLPKPALRLLKAVLLIAAAAVCWLARPYAPWNWAGCALLALSVFATDRKLRQALMLLIAAALITAGLIGIPWFVLQGGFPQYMLLPGEPLAAVIGGVLGLCALLPHRGFTHTLYATAIWTGLLYWIAPAEPAVWQAGGIAYLLHLLTDALTQRGIRPLPPLEWKLCIPLMRTGKFSAAVFETLFIGMTFVLVWIVFVQMGGWRLWIG
ncbi:metal-dependent hydrolase [Paenibacillus beijingensis]|uniref:Metal-dependent hydrolase n=1 Tax=Paenibacillus beijingensis TaxID=1126833 RepID=A0A0D5NHK2_9BACL|nr:metal-dependent hydrolase [Paenibacillus beijingensis]AJY74452.1 hypothetical protein VN24_07540 [Paenibacillus beijingensis]